MFQGGWTGFCKETKEVTQRGGRDDGSQGPERVGPHRLIERVEAVLTDEEVGVLEAGERRDLTGVLGSGGLCVGNRLVRNRNGGPVRKRR